jgi:hypothetical protein
MIEVLFEACDGIRRAALLDSTDVPNQFFFYAFDLVTPRTALGVSSRLDGGREPVVPAVDPKPLRPENELWLGIGQSLHFLTCNPLRLSDSV